MRLPVVFATALLTSCAQPQSVPTAADDPSQACFRALAEDPVYEPLRSKIGSPVRINALTLEMLTRTDKATADDKPILERWAADRQECVSEGEFFRERNMAPGIAQAISAQQSELFDSIRALYNGEISYGEFNTRRKRMAEQTQRRLIGISQDARERQAAQAEERRRNALNTYLLIQAAQPKPAAPAIPFPSPTHCTTQYIGSFAYTNCY
jgi:hypothetical protein